MDFQGTGAPATRDGILAVLDKLNVKLPQLLAVASVETSGCGFLADRRPAILFERHIFSRQTGGKFDSQHSDISNPTPGGYSHGAAEYERLGKAVQLDRMAALKSASWGIGQVMGFNFDKAGYGNVESMVQKAMESEDEQLLAMANFLKATGLDRPLAAQDWTSFARGYNGPDFSRNLYDAKLAAAFQRYQFPPLPDITVRTAQMLLSYAGFHPGGVDGLTGKFTRAAAQDFREAHGMGTSDQIDEQLIDALRAVGY
ncbi:MAG: N-acetylmuramidase domain-containing protein [Bryobacteraceae bacterium]